MSNLPVEIYQALNALLSSDNQLRKQAEIFFNNQIEANFLVIIQILLDFFQNSNTEHVIRSLIGVLLRRLIEKSSNQIDERALTSIRQIFMNLWINETDVIILRRLSHIVAQSASSSSWIDLIPNVLNHANGKPNDIVKSTLQLIEIICEYCPDDIQTHLMRLGTFLGQYITSSDKLVQIHCARATAACIVALEDDNSRNCFISALQPMVNVVGDALARGDEADACNIMDYLVTIAQQHPMFYKSSVDFVASAMLTIANANQLEFSTRSIAVEILITLTETAPALSRRCQALSQGLVPVVMNIILDFEEEPSDWITQTYTEDSLDSNSTLGEEAIERAVSGMGGKILAPQIIDFVQQYSNNNDWRYRRAAVAAIARLAEGCTQFFQKSYLQQSKNALGMFLDDSSPIVQFEAIQTIGRFAILFPSENESFNALYIPQLIAKLHCSNSIVCDRVRGHAASAFINLCNPEHCQASYILPHLENLLQAMLSCLQVSPVSIQSPVVVLLGCVAQVMSDQFAPYYSMFMPGDAVGVEIFAPDALEIMQSLVGAMELDRNNDCTFEYILPACARISKALGAQFQSILPYIMPALLEGANQKINFSMEDADDDDVEGDVERDEETGDETAVISFGGGIKKRVTMNTLVVQQKTQASKLIFEFAKNLKGHLGIGYLNLCLDSLLNMVTDKHSADIRSSAALAIVPIFEGFIHGHELGFLNESPDPYGILNEILTKIVFKLLENLRGEINTLCRACSAESLRDVLLASYNTGTTLPDGTLANAKIIPPLKLCEDFATHILHCCAETIERIRQQEQDFQTNEGVEDEDRDAFLEELEEEEDLLTNLGDALGHLLKLHRENFMAYFDSSIASSFAPFLDSNHPDSFKAVAVCLIDDVIEFGGQLSFKYIPHALNAFLANMNSEHITLRQSSVYGIAQALYYAPQQCMDSLSIIVPSLFNCINHINAKTEDYEGTTENAVYALGIIYCNPSFHQQISLWSSNQTLHQFSSSIILKLWMKNLPLKTDEKSAKLSHQMLCNILEKGDSDIFPFHASESMPSMKYENLGEALRVIAEVVCDYQQQQQPMVKKGYDHYHLADPMTLNRMDNFVKQIIHNGGLAQDDLMCCMSFLTPQLQQVIHQMM